MNEWRNARSRASLALLTLLCLARGLAGQDVIATPKGDGSAAEGTVFPGQAPPAPAPVAAPRHCDLFFDQAAKKDLAQQLITIWPNPSVPAVAPTADEGRTAWRAEACACSEALLNDIANVKTKTAALSAAKGGRIEKLAPKTQPLLLDGQAELARSINEYLLDSHVRYQRLRTWYRSLSSKPLGASLIGDPGERKCRTRIETDLRDFVHSAMDSRGMRRPFSAVLVAGGLVNVPGSGSNAVNTSEAKSAAANAHIEWESQHVELAQNKVGFRVLGSFGIQSVTALFAKDGDSPATATEGARMSSSVSFEPTQAFVWDVGVAPTAHLDHLMFSGAFRVGQSVLTSITKVEDLGDGTGIIKVPLAGEQSRAEWFWDAGGTITLFDQDVETIHEERSALAPIATLRFGARKDNRLRLSAGGGANFDTSQNRWYAGFLLNALQVIDRRPKGKQETFTVSFGVEHEWARGASSTAPANTRFVLSGDLALLKILQGGS